MDRAFQRIRSLMLRGTFYSVPPKFYQIYIETDRCIQKKEKLTPKENSISFLSYKILLYYSSV